MVACLEYSFIIVEVYCEVLKGKQKVWYGYKCGFLNSNGYLPKVLI